jgi:tetratricopeptide (TPR) repeat protein
MNLWRSRWLGLRCKGRFLWSGVLVCSLLLVMPSLLSRIAANTASVILLKLDGVEHWSEVQALISTFIAHDRDVAQVYRIYGIGLLRQTRYNDAVQSLSESARLEPENTFTQFALGNAYAGYGNTARAIELWRSANAVMYFVRCGDNAPSAEGAEQCYLRATQISPEVGGVALGEFYWRRSRMEESAQAFTLSAEHSKSPFWANLARGRAEIVYGQWASAVVSLQEALEHASSTDMRAGVLHYLAYAEWRNGDWESALRHFQERVELVPDMQAYIWMGDVYRARGDVGRAIKAYESALTLAPSHPLPRERLENLPAIEGELDGQ